MDVAFPFNGDGVVVVEKIGRHLPNGEFFRNPMRHVQVLRPPRLTQ